LWVFGMIKFFVFQGVIFKFSNFQIMKNFLITGASKGIGFETALALCRQDCQVLALSRDEAGLSRLQVAAAGATGGLDTLVYDLMQPDTAALLEWINRQGGLAGEFCGEPFRGSLFDSNSNAVSAGKRNGAHCQYREYGRFSGQFQISGVVGLQRIQSRIGQPDRMLGRRAEG